MNRDRSCDRLGQSDRHGVADLSRDIDFLPAPRERIRESLESGSFPMGNWPIDASVRRICGPLRMEILALFRLEELGSNRERWSIPAHAPHHIGGA